MKQLLSFFLILIVGACFAAPTVEHRAVSESYEEPEIKIVFPAEIGKFRKNEVSRSFNPMIGTKIRYSDADGYCADIFIYSLPVDAKTVSPTMLEEHYKTVKAAILDLSSRTPSVKKVTLPSEKSIFDKKIGSTVYTAAFLLSWNSGKEQTSTMTLFSYKGKVIKLRISCTGDDAEQFSNAVLKIFHP